MASYDPASLAFVVTVLFGILVALLAAFFRARTFSIHQKQPETAEHRINRLKKSLSDALNTIREIEDEVKIRQELVSKLESDVEKYRQIPAFKREEVEAIAQLVSGEMQQGESHSFWWNAAQFFIFIAIGALISYIFIKIILSL